MMLQPMLNYVCNCAAVSGSHGVGSWTFLAKAFSSKLSNFPLECHNKHSVLYLLHNKAGSHTTSGSWQSLGQSRCY